MIKREITQELTACADEYPVVTILGPRQSGKTTLARMTFPEKQYISLEEPDIRAAVISDPRGFLKGIKDGAILDEIQRVPELLSYIQGIVDEQNSPGMFILTGSHQPQLQQDISQSLAGRTALLTLLPFSLDEITGYGPLPEVFELIVQGFYPRLHDKKLKTERFYRSYLQTYVERDVRALINIKDLRVFQNFLTLLAGRVGQVVNYSSLANDTGVSSMTIKNWISVMKASFIVFELPPFFRNINKRVIKSPKVYFYDTGLVSFLLGIKNATQLFRDPLRGGLYENLMILETLKNRLNIGRTPELYFYRDTNGNEVDMLVSDAAKLLPVEIKSASTFTSSFLSGITKFREISDSCSGSAAVLYNGDQSYNPHGINVFNPMKDLEQFKALAMT